MEEGTVPMLDETRKTPRDVIVNRINASWDKVGNTTITNKCLEMSTICIPSLRFKNNF